MMTPATDERLMNPEDVVDLGDLSATGDLTRTSDGH
jgi:hypothetical protein